MSKSVPSRFVAVSSLLFLSVALPAIAGQGTKVKEPLDHATIFQDSISKSTPVRLRPFDTENADLGTGATNKKPKYRQVALDMQENAPRLMTEGTLDELKAAGFTDVAELGPDESPEGEALIVEGEFTVLNPGSKGKRYAVGFGAGKSKICVAGRVLNAADQVLAEFDHCRYQAMGLFGGDSDAQMMKDTVRSGERFAEFMANWANGVYAD